MDAHSSPALCGELPLLDRILFMPSPILEAIQAQLSISDIVTLSRVCRAWRRYLIPDDSTSQPGSAVSLDTQWHALVRTVAAPRIPPKKQKYIYDKRVNYSIGESYLEEYGFMYFAPFDWLRRIFGPTYQAAITRIYLDGTVVCIYPSSALVALRWVFYCPNLAVLSLRWCTGIDMDDVTTLFLDPLRQELSIYSGQTQEVLRALRALMVWGVEGTVHPWQSNPILKSRCSSLMKRYHTDLDWCPAAIHDGSMPASKSLLNVGKRQCGICFISKEPKCVSCEVRNVCEECQGFVCDECLTVKEVNERIDWEALMYPSGPDTPTMLQYRCFRSTACYWRDERHYFHPSCAPRELTPQGGRNPRLCSGCKNLFCQLDRDRGRVCRFCGASTSCCPSEDTFCIRCGMMVCGRCGKCKAVVGHADGYQKGTENDLNAILADMF